MTQLMVEMGMLTPLDFSGASSDYTITSVGGTTTVTDNNSGDGMMMEQTR